MTATDTDAYASPLLGLAGAVAADPPDSGVAAHYGDPMREQRRLAVDRMDFVDLSHRGVVRVAGPDRLSWLHALTTQDVEHLAPGESASALLLSPHGHVEHALAMVDDGEAVWMHVEPGTAPQVVAFLESMRFLMRVEVSDLSAEYAIRWEPTAEGVTAEGVTAEGTAEGTTDHLTRQGADSLGGREIFVPRSKLAETARRVVEAAGDTGSAAGVREAAGAGDTAAAAGPGRPAGLWAYEALRIAAHLPRAGFETDHRTIPNEVGWLGTAVHLHKGCYRGQETVARVHTLGRPPRRLVFLHLDGSVDRLPGHGAPVTHEDRAVGFVTSSARHFEMGPVTLALIRRNVPVDADLLADGVAAAQEVVVPPDAGLHVRPKLRA
ncbi:folate-binding protein [Actinopolymorpha sp. B11F2]|uniref:CAF17-like 4Fe-4S cluster assembly/insertion protein YgfZ n=1 Tax=Actinopolymorpha sp. B11F2 TaxID=3160862 RepID=UPI0032E3E40C